MSIVDAYQAGSTAIFVCSGFSSGLTGTIAVTVLTSAGGTQIARTTSGIIETGGSCGIYHGTVVTPSSSGVWTARWDTGTLSASTVAVEQFATTTDPVAVINVGTAVFTYEGSDPGTFTYSA